MTTYFDFFYWISETDLVHLGQLDAADFNKFLSRIATFFNEEGVVSVSEVTVQNKSKRFWLHINEKNSAIVFLLYSFPHSN